MKFALPLFTLMLAGNVGATAAERWYDHAVIYEIYPRSFQDTNSDGIGDLNGITQHLDYLKRLGVDAIWITPFFPSPNADFGYDISDYTDVAKEYGTMADWDKLVTEAKQRDIRVLVDFVVNHTSDQHSWFKESRSSKDNPKRDWYIWRDGKAPGEPPTHWTSIFGGYTWTYDKPTKQWYYHVFLPQQPDVNWGNAGLRNAMYDVMRFWLKHGASGFRLDATPYLFEDPNFPEDPHPPAKGGPAALMPYNSARPENHDVMRGMRKVVDEHAGDAVLLGESSTATIQDLAKVYGENNDEVQLPMDFLFGNQTKLNAKELKKQVDAAQLELGPTHTPVFFFSSHDHSRQWSVFGDGKHNDAIAKLTAALTLTQRGTVLLYYGEELGMATAPSSFFKNVPLGPKRPVADDRDGERTPMQWNSQKNAGFSTGTPWLPAENGFKNRNAEEEAADGQSILSWYTSLIKLRKDNPIFRSGSYVQMQSGNEDVLVFGRKASEGTALVVLNMSNRQQQVHLSGWKSDTPKFSQVLLSSPDASAPGSDSFSVAPYGVLIASTN